VTSPGLWNDATNQAFPAALGNHLWQSTGMTVVVWVLSLSLRKNDSRIRYRLWMVASVKFLVPFSLFINAGEWLRSVVAPPVQSPAIASALQQLALPFPQSDGFAVPSAGTGMASVPHSVAFPLLAVLWACGSLIVAIAWSRKWLRLRAVVRAAAPLSLGVDVPSYSSSSLLEPGVFGIFRPVLMLPEGILARLTREQLDAVIGHEMCHVRRRDNMTFAMHMVVETLFWFHPLVWWIGTRLVEEREQACDEAVLQSGSRAAVYAEGILRVCKSYVESPLGCVSGVSGADLKKRIARIMAKHMGERLSLRRKLILIAAGILIVGLPLALGALQPSEASARSASAGQTAVPEWQTRAGGKMSFEVASIHLSKPGAFTPPNFALDDLDNFDGENPHGRFYADFPLEVYITFAYKLHVTAAETHTLVTPLDKWISTDSFVIQAKAEGSPTKDQMRLMVQPLLADRFGLSAHYENQEVPVFTLVLNKPGRTGPKLRPHAEGTPCDVKVPSPENDVPFRPGPVFPTICNAVMLVPKPNHAMLLGSRNITIDAIAGALPSVERLGRPVVDETGLTGTFDFTLEWMPEPDHAAAPGAPIPPDSEAPSFMGALNDQLGLKLRSGKASLPVLIVDHVERPSEN
jgi:bla regulator protein BlaR1